MCPQVLSTECTCIESCSICCEVIQSVSVAADNLAPSLLPSADKSIYHHPSSETFLANLERHDYHASPPPVDHEQKPVISRAMSAACRVSVLLTLQRAIVRPGMSYLVQVGEAVKLVMGWPRFQHGAPSVCTAGLAREGRNHTCCVVRSVQHLG